MANGSQFNTWEKVARISQAASSLSIVVGITVALFGVYNTLQNARLAIRASRLSSLTTLNQFVDRDTQIRAQADAFLDKYKTREELAQALHKYSSNQRAYDSEEFKDLREIGHHYEQIATLVRLGYVDFDLVYNTIPFPDDFWDRTADFRREVQTKNWSGDGKALPDFWSNMEYLKGLYEDQRALDKADRETRAAAAGH